VSTLTSGNATNKILSQAIYLPSRGQWRVGATLADGTPPAVGARATVESYGLTLVGAVELSGDESPHRPSVVVRGGLGWDRPLEQPLAYQSSAGVRRSTVLADLARLAGETIEQPPDGTIGAWFGTDSQSQGRPVRLRDVLDTLVANGHLADWYVSPDGVTRFGPRTGTTVTARATVIRQNPATGLSVIGLDEPAAFVPGMVLGGSPIVRAEIIETAGKLEGYIYQNPAPASPALSIRQSIGRMVGDIFPQLVYGYPRTYVVAGINDDGTLSLAPPPGSEYLRSLPSVEQWAEGGNIVKPQPGARVVVVFADADPATPRIVGFAPGNPQRLTILSGTMGAARVGDPVGPYVITAGSTDVLVG